MPPVLRNDNMDATSSSNRGASGICQHPGCAVKFMGAGHSCPKHFLTQPRNSTGKKPSGPLPANSRLGTEFTERSGKTARKGTARNSAQASRSASQKQPAAHQLRNSTPTIPPPRTRARRNGSSPLKMAHSPPSDSETAVKVLSDEEVIEVEAWSEEHDTPSDKDQEGSLDTSPQYDPRLLGSKLVTRDSSKQQEPLHRLLPSTQGIPAQYAGESSMPTPSSGSFIGSPDAASRKRPRSSDPLAPTRHFTARQPVSPYLYAGSSSNDRDESEYDLVPESPIESDSGHFDMNDDIEMPPTKTPPAEKPCQKPGRLTNGQLHAKVVRDFDQDRLDSALYGQEGAGSPPKGVTPLRRKSIDLPSEKDGRLYLRIDPRIHWPRDWTDEWYEEKMKEIKARGNRKANFGKVEKRMREQFFKEQARVAEERAFVAKQREAIAAGEPLPQRRGYQEPRPWGHQRHIDFGDVPEENLPQFVKADPAWVKACAWLRTNRVKEAKREKEVERLKAIGRSFRHLQGRTGW